MSSAGTGEEPRDKRDGSGPFFVSAGIAMFVIGFVMTVVFSAAVSVDNSGVVSEAALSNSGSGDMSTFENIMAFLGIFIGLMGVVTATMGPLTTVVIKKGRR